MGSLESMICALSQEGCGRVRTAHHLPSPKPHLAVCEACTHGSFSNPFHTCSTLVGEVLYMFTDRAPVWEKL